MPVVALPALGIVAAALVALLVLLASGLLTKFVGYLMPDWHIPGYSQLRSAVMAGIDSVLNAIGSTLDNALQPLGRIVAYPVAVIKSLIGGIAGSLEAAAVTLVWIVRHAIPRAIHALRKALDHAITAARHYAWSLVHRAEHYLHHLIQLARAYAAGLVAAAVHQLHRLIHDARHYAAGLVAALAVTVTREIHTALHTAEAYTDKAVHTIKVTLSNIDAAIRNAITTAEHYTDAAVKSAVTTAETSAAKAAAALVTDLDKSATAAVDAVWGGVTDEVKTLEGIIGTDLPRIGAALGDIPADVPADLAAALAGLGALAIPALRYMEDCGIPNCRNLSQFGRDLQALIGVVSAGALLGMFAELATDPEGTAAVVVDVLTPLADGAIGEAKSLLGIG